MLPSPKSGTIGSRSHQADERGQERVVGAEHHARPQDRRAGKTRAHRVLAFAARADVGRGRSGVGADARDVHQAVEPGFGCRPCEFAGALDMDRLVGCVSALDIERDRIDRGIGAVERGPDRMGVTQIGLHPNPAVDACPVVAAGGMTRGDTDRQAACEQGVDNVPTEEACAAEDGDAAAHGLPVGEAVAQRSAEIGSLAHWAVRSFRWRDDIDVRAFVRPTTPPAIVAGGTIFNASRL